MKALPALFAASFSVLSLCVLHAADPLTQWGSRVAPGSGYGLNGIAFGAGVFVTVGGNGTILVSSDGANWTNSSPGNYGELTRIRFLNGAFNVVGQTNRLLRSSNGVDWTVITLPTGSYGDVAYGNGVYLVTEIIGGDTFGSSDGVTWAAMGPRITVPWVRPVPFHCLTFGAGKFVALPFRTLGLAIPSPTALYSSTNGSNWVFTTGGPIHDFSYSGPRMEYLNGLYLISRAGGLIWFSSNGLDWAQSGPNDPFGPHCGVAYGGGRFVTAFADFAYSSSNAVSWAGGYVGPVRKNDVAFGHGTFVIVGGTNGGGAVIYQSGNLSGAPFILTEPLDRAAVVNNPASFSVLASGADPLSYQWYKTNSPIADATNTTFTITNVVAGDAGGYYAVANNSFGSVTSRVAQLTVSFLQIHQYAGITILGVPGKTYRIEASPQAGGAWTVLTNLVLPQTPFIWIDYDSPNVAARVYRAAELQ